MTRDNRIAELENKIADIKANCDLAIEGRDVKIKELEEDVRNKKIAIKNRNAEIKLLGERCNQLLKDKGDLTDRIKKMRNCGNCNGIIEGGIRTKKCKICMRGKDLSQWELKND